MYEDAYKAQEIRNHAWQARYVNLESGVTRELLANSLAKLPPSSKDVEVYRRMLDKPENKGKNLVAVLDGKIIGILTYNTIDEDTGDIGVFVADEFNEKGVGAKLLDNLIANTTNDLRVTIFAKNPSRSFYKKHGFIEDGEEFKHYFNDEVYLPVQALRLHRQASIS